jgi:hypothetical protein
MRSSATWLFVGVLFTVLIALCGAWIASLNKKPFTFWTAHPWVVFWISIGFLSTLADSLLFHPRVSELALGFGGAVVSAISASHGLELTWKRSWLRAVFVVFAILVVGHFMAAFLIDAPSGVQIPPGEMAAALLTPAATIIWLVGIAVMRHYFARWLASRRPPNEVLQSSSHGTRRQQSKRAKSARG